MHVVGGIKVDLNWFLQLIFTVILIALGLLHLVKNTASKYFEVDANFEGGGGANTAHRRIPPARALASAAAAAPSSMDTDDVPCAHCGKPGGKKCSRCKSVRYCSQDCQEKHWKAGHKSKCKDFSKVSSVRSEKDNFGHKCSSVGSRIFSGIALVPLTGSYKTTKKPRKVLFPYDEFVKLYNWNKPGFRPCGLLNCGNSCFANVVLQCLTFTRPLVAYLMEKGHRTECRHNDWCFLCVFQEHVERATQSLLPFSPINILSRLPNIGGNLGYGRQEDAHEFMRFAIDTMQSVCLDEFGGEKAVDPAAQETTLIQHIFGGHLQSQVICTKCDKVSNQFENMLDLTVEIHGDAASLEECLDQFTVKEWLHGENMYKCDGCNDYVKAWKRLTIRKAPNILTVALKRFQSGRFGKLNKRVTFPDTLDLSPYMSEEADGTDIYKLYAVVVHVDMLNASFFGHYICYTKDFSGNWYRIDDCKVFSVELDEVLSQGAYMLLYSRVSVRPSCLRTFESSKECQQMVKAELNSSIKENGECFSALHPMNSMSSSSSLASESNSEVLTEPLEDGAVLFGSSSAVSREVFPSEIELSSGIDYEVSREAGDMDKPTSEFCSSSVKVYTSGRNDPVEYTMETLVEESESLDAMDCDSASSVPVEASGPVKDSCAVIDCSVVELDDLGSTCLANPKPGSAIVKDIKVNGTICSLPGEASSSKTHSLKRESPCCDPDNCGGNEAKRAEITDSH